MKNIFKVGSLCMSMALCFACNNLEDVNKNPNSVEDGVLNVDRFITGVQTGMSPIYTTLGLDVTSKFVQHTEWPSQHWTSNLDKSTRQEDVWIAHFKQLRNVNYIIDNANDDYANYKGMALTVKAWMDYMMTSCYGDIPYSEAGKAKEDINTPKYDAQEDVFKGILANLEEANALLGTGIFALNGDFLLGNDILKWKKFANSLRVRVLIAQSKKIDPSVELKKIVSNPTTYPLMESNDDQPGFSYTNTSSHPRNPSGSYFIDQTFLCSTLLDKLVDYNDDRLKLFAGKTTADGLDPYVGIPSGTSELPNLGAASSISPFIFISPANFALQQVWMHYSELEFLLAEAAEKGWIDGGTAAAKQYYEKGIKASYDYQLGVQTDGLGGVLKTSLFDYTGKIDPMGDWDDAYYLQAGVAYGTDNLHKIAEQKWIALYCDIEGWFSHRRTGLPRLTVNPDQDNEGVIPLRFKYPEDDKTFNSENYKAAVAVQGPDEWDTKMWLLK